MRVEKQTRMLAMICTGFGMLWCGMALGAPVEEAPFQGHWEGDEIERLRALTQSCQDRFIEQHRTIVGEEASGP